MKTFLSVLLVLTSPVPAFSQKIINVDFSSVQGTIKDLAGVNCGPGNALNTYKDAGVSIIRTHDYYGPTDYDTYTTFYNKTTGSFNTSFDPANPAHYSWASSDLKIDSIVRFGFKVFFRLGISWPNASTPTVPPLDPDGKSFTKFAGLCKQTVMHYNHGWNNGFKYGIQYWEVWNEPDGVFFKGTPEQFFQLYKTVSDSLKNLDPALKVGSPGVSPLTTVGKKYVYLKDFLSFCKTNSVKLDFYSWHLYGQKNPYAIKEYGDFVKSQLNSYGFTSSESCLDEVNIDGGAEGQQAMKSAKSAAYMASIMIAALQGSIDKVFIYRGNEFLNLFGPDAGSQPFYNMSGCGFKAFALLSANTPIKIQSDNSEIVSGSSEADTTNFMILSGKSNDQKSVYVLVSNYNSRHSSFTVNVSKLPWKSSGTVRVRQNVTKDPADKFKETVTTMNGAGTLSCTVQNVPSPSVVLLRFEYSGDLVHVNDHPNNVQRSFLLEDNYPNPFNPTTTIRFALPIASNVTLKILNALGEEVTTIVNEHRELGSHSVQWNASNVPSGVYFYRLQAGGFVETKKMVLLR